MNYNQGGYNAPMSFNPSNSYSQDDASEFLDFDVSSIDPNAEPWEIAQRLGGTDRDIGSGQELQKAFNQAQSMSVNLDANSARGMFNEANTTSRGGGGTSLSTKLIAGAAGWAAMSYYQSYQKKQGHKVNHAFIKKMVAGIAMAQAIKMYNKQSSGSSGFMGFGGGRKEIGASRDVVAAEAAANAMKLVDDQLGPEQSNNYGQPPVGSNQSYGQNYSSQPSYGGPSPNQNFNTQNSYGGPPQNSNYGGPSGFGGPPLNQNYGGYGPPQTGPGNYPQAGYNSGPTNMNNGPPFPNQGGPGNFPNPNGPPPYNPGPGGFFNPNMPKY